MSMTRKDYQAIAGCIAEISADKKPGTEVFNILHKLTLNLARELSDNNPKFNYAKFINACLFTE